MREKPDYHVIGRSSMTLEEGPIGAAWRRYDGSIEIRLCPFTNLMASPSLSIWLMPAEEAPATAEADDDAPPSISPGPIQDPLSDSPADFPELDFDSIDDSDIPF